MTIARLIFQSQTGCYARERRSAIHALGDGYDCSQNPEILVAFVYALNDTDERVEPRRPTRSVIRSENIPTAPFRRSSRPFKLALGDCDKRVRPEARLALSDCGIEVVRVKDGSCARPAENCAPRPPAAPKAQLPASPEKSSVEPDPPSDGFLQDVELDPETESIEVSEAPEEPVAKPTRRRGLSGLVEYLKER
ncbi:MAG: hypothetical protein Ct9H300mP1_18630 [Planctomycetaceae bacterium]|nr:MAG: hypothetical protein Ct9H300mP1_18630 [Planctomycetaceae bacterium]